MKILVILNAVDEEKEEHDINKNSSVLFSMQA
jgi:hypothetical protein